MSDNRTNPRFGPLVIRAQIVVDGNALEGYLTNISTGGAFLAIDDPPPIGSELSIRAILPWNLGELRAHTRVVWRNEDGSEKDNAPIAGVGVAFTELEEGSPQALDAYLKRFEELAAQIDSVQ